MTPHIDGTGVCRRARRGPAAGERDVAGRMALVPASYDVLVLGGAVYTGRWRRSAVRLLRRAAEAVEAGASLQVWLFQSGLLGGDPADPEHEAEYHAPGRVALLAARRLLNNPRGAGGHVAVT